MNSSAINSFNQQTFRKNTNATKNNPTFTADFKIAKEVETIANKYTTYKTPINKIKGIFASIKNYSLAMLKKGPRNVSSEEVQEISSNSFLKSVFPDSAKSFSEDFKRRTNKILPGKVEMVPTTTSNGNKSSTLVSLKYTNENGEIHGPTLGTPLTSYIPKETDPSSLKDSVINVLSDLAAIKKTTVTPLDFQMVLHDVKLDRYI